MTGSRFFWLAFFIALFASASSARPNPDPASVVSLTPAVVVVGSPELIRIVGPTSAKLSGDWLGRKLEFFYSHNDHAWFALAGVDVEAASGASTLCMTEELSNGATVGLSRIVEIRPAHYHTTALNVSPKFVEPDPEELKRIEAEIQLKAKVFATSAAEPLWHGSFHAPVRSAPTDSFGTRRIFNGKLDSVHKGMDFRAHMGTPVHASNSGVVVLARPLYFEGNCVVIDHGLSLFTISMHLSRIDVHEGQHVATGQLLGLSGATGRVTGSHLHWAVRWENSYLDPAKLLRMNLSDIR